MEKGFLSTAFKFAKDVLNDKFSTVVGAGLAVAPVLVGAMGVVPSMSLAQFAMLGVLLGGIYKTAFGSILVASGLDKTFNDAFENDFKKYVSSFRP